ncbi:MAG: hypothetical protein HQM02_11320 [Magnetococcales bacterium]|nr:hypothetical protein [Magnetococcales bacterium]
MPTTEKHQQISMTRTGSDHGALHRWINDPNMQLARHDFTRIPEFTPEVREKFGENGVLEYVEHLRVDMETKFTNIWGKDESVRDDALAYFGIRRKSE